VDEEGIVYVSDTGNRQIRIITPEGEVTSLRHSQARKHSFGGASTLRSSALLTAPPLAYRETGAEHSSLEK
jgi:hypothetical protein